MEFFNEICIKILLNNKNFKILIKNCLEYQATITIHFIIKKDIKCVFTNWYFIIIKLLTIYTYKLCSSIQAVLMASSHKFQEELCTNWNNKPSSWETRKSAELRIWRRVKWHFTVNLLRREIVSESLTYSLTTNPRVENINFPKNK